MRHILLSFLAAVLLISAERASCELNISSPDGNILPGASDYAAEVLNNPWDMSDQDDISRHIVGDNGANVRIENGRLIVPDNEQFYLISPAICSTNRIGKTGHKFPIDTTKYRYLTIRMYSEQGSALRVIVNTGCDYFTTFWETVPIGTSAGWRTYTIDMLTAPHQGGQGAAWNSQPVTGIRIDPTLYGSPVQIDWITLTATPPAGTHNVSYTFNATAAPAHTLFLDTDTNLTNGYERTLVPVATSATPVSISASGLMPGTSYYVNGVESPDFAALLLDPWDMDNPNDISSTFGLTGSFGGGTFNAAAPNSSSLFLNMGGQILNPLLFRFFTLDITSSAGSTVNFYWYDQNGTFRGSVPMNVGAGRATYNVNLGAIPQWSGQVSGLQLVFSQAGTVNVQIHSAALRSDGFGGPDLSPTIVSSPGSLHINQPPLVKILQPDEKGGEDFASAVLGNPWNMDTADDIFSTENEITPRILPDSSISGVRGNFFAAQNSTDNGDPYQVSLFQYSNASKHIDTGRYKNLTFKLFVDRPQDIVHGSVVRIVWGLAGGGMNFYSSDDIITQGGWNEYTVDMSSIVLEELSHAPGSYPVPPWQQKVWLFRVDPHEFTWPAPFYYDYIRLTADDEANSRFAVAFDASDSDSPSNSVTLDFFYSSAQALSGGTPIGSVRLDEGRVLTWDTSAVPEGSYWIYAVANDGYNTSTRLSTGKVTITRSRPQNSFAPILSIDNPAPGSVLYDTFVAAGSAIDDLQMAGIEVLVDGNWVDSIRIGRYDPAVQAAYWGYAEAGNAGFRKTVDLSSVAPGPHNMTLVAYDTQGNQTVSGTVPFTKAAGADPSPYPEPTSADASPITIGNPSSGTNKLGLKASMNLKKKQVNIQITNGGGCATLSLFGSVTKNLLTGRASSATLIRSKAGAASVKWTATKLRGAKKAKSGNSVYVAAACDGSISSPVRTLNPSKIGSKPLKSAAAWIGHLKGKMR